MRNFDLLEFLSRRLRPVKVLLEAHLLEIFFTVEMRQYNPGAIEDLMQIVVILLHNVLNNDHVLKKSTKLTLDPLVISINFLMKTEEKFTITHYTRSSGLRILL